MAVNHVSKPFNLTNTNNARHNIYITSATPVLPLKNLACKIGKADEERLPATKISDNRGLYTDCNEMKTGQKNYNMWHIYKKYYTAKNILLDHNHHHHHHHHFRLQFGH